LQVKQEDLTHASYVTHVWAKTRWTTQ
jgi:hypothetical protein